MHELSVMMSILDVVNKHAKMNNVKKVQKIYLKVGELADIEDKWMQHYFEYASKNSLAEDAKLEITRIPVKMKCDDCSAEFEPNMKEEKIICPVCESKKHTLIEGTGYYVTDMEAIV